MNIGVDLDGVLARWDSSFAELLVETSGRNLLPDPLEPPCWGWPGYYGYTKAEESKAWEAIKQSPVFWETLEGYPEAGDALNRIYSRIIKGDDVTFITSRVGEVKLSTPKAQTENWLKHQLSLVRITGWHDFIPTVIITNQKGLAARLLELDYYIDDRWENCVDVVNNSPTTQVYLRDQPWNRTQDSRGLVRVATVLEMLEDL